MAENRYTSDLVLKGDALDRGEYALTLFKIIADYSPKKSPRGYEIIDTIDLGPINRGENQLSKTSEKETREVKSSQELIGENQEQVLPNETRTTSSNVDYTSKYHHLQDNDAFIIGISGAWGTGKTTFVKMFERLLINNDDGILYISDTAKETINEETTYQEDEVIYFNSWLNDFYENPMIPFSKLLIEKICGKNPKDYTNASEEFSSYLNILRNTNAGFYQKNDNDQNNDNDIPLEKRISNLKSILHKCIRDENKKQRKVVVIVDELDRCKPTFAIQLLEVVKHLFNVKGLVFIFSLDIGELQHCVKTVYGQGFDAIGYLQRFFDYCSILPKGNDKNLMDKYSKEYELPDSEEYYKLCKTFSLTPREMEGVCSSFFYINKYSLEGYPDKARLLYFYILLLKYKYPDDVQVLNDRNDDGKRARDKLFGEQAKRPEFLTVDDTYQPFFSAVINNQTLGDTQLYLIENVDSGQKAQCGNPVFIKQQEPLLTNSTASCSFILYARYFEKGIPTPSDTYVIEFLFNKVESYSKDFPMTKKEEKIHRGSIVTFGKWHYTLRSKTKEDMQPIQWIVLDTRDNIALLISKFGLDLQRYNQDRGQTTWKDCTLKRWLNNTFLMGAFSEEERDKKIVGINVIEKRKLLYPEIKLSNDNMSDKVFLLSSQEVSMYLPTKKSRICPSTKYIIKKGSWNDNDNKNCQWWLRSSGNAAHYAAFVSKDGSLNDNGDYVHKDSYVVRPSIWIFI